MIGIRTHTALALVVETGDFHRFQKPEQYASFLGLVLGERSSSDNQNRLSITKAGNSHLRLLLTEAAQCCCHSRSEGVGMLYMGYDDGAYGLKMGVE